MKIIHWGKKSIPIIFETKSCANTREFTRSLPEGKGSQTEQKPIMLTNPKASFTKHFMPGLSRLLAGYSQPVAVGLLTRDVRQPKKTRTVNVCSKVGFEA